MAEKAHTTAAPAVRPPHWPPNATPAIQRLALSVPELHARMAREEASTQRFLKAIGSPAGMA